MSAELFITEKIKGCIAALYGLENCAVQLTKTRREYESDLTLVTFPIAKLSRKTPELLGAEIGEWLKANVPQVAAYNVVKGFLNIVLAKSFWLEQLEQMAASENFGCAEKNSSGKTVMVEYSSPNTNKPLHLGHIRNNLLGFAVANILEANGHRVVKVNLVNDRGIHICKSMLAWQRYGQGATPEAAHKKGDHLVGDYYVQFDKAYKQEVASLVAQGLSEDEAKKQAPILQEAQRMLLSWEQGDADVRSLWETMNSWVYAGFDETYRQLGVSFDKIYYESQTYLLGKELVNDGLQKGVFVRNDDGSVWCDLTADGLDQKLLLRSDGTSVYMTQDLGTARQRYDEYKFGELIYVVGNEQNYHFQVLRLVLKKLGYDWADSIFHLSYGMVELPAGKMKSREGPVVDADDLMDAMIATARETSQELGKLDDMPADEQQRLFRMVGLAALKYFILKVDPQKTMLFNPKESIDFNGNTGPFIQYTHARICSVMRKASDAPSLAGIDADLIGARELELVKTMSTFPQVVLQAGAEHSPALVANFAYELAKEFNQYYHDVTILHEENIALRTLKLVLAKQVGRALKTAMGLLGIEVPERM
ncbi:MAG: arginine--tRNA ligase [Prevotellaceae bacterium]|jgi:arginyl-tRNA synthetase|nr:arginine--tRNA ligase [Prevotellaceae bacterium]